MAHRSAAALLLLVAAVAHVSGAPLQLALSRREQVVGTILSDGVSARLVRHPVRARPWAKGGLLAAAGEPRVGAFPHHVRLNYSEAIMTVDIAVGPQNFTVQVDTGSSDTAVYSVLCHNCTSGPNPPFDAAKNGATTVPCTAFKACHCVPAPYNGCGYADGYGDGTGFKALTYEAPMRFRSEDGALIAPGTYIGAIGIEIGTFMPPTADGIMGFAYSSISALGAPTPFDRLVQSGLVAENMFGICFTYDGVYNTWATGVLTLGGTGAKDDKDVAWTPVLNEEFYTVYVSGVSFGDVAMNVPPSVFNNATMGGTIFDSGTTNWIIPTSLATAIQTSAGYMCEAGMPLRGVCDQPKGHTLFDGYCFSFTDEQLAAFPAVTIYIGKSVEDPDFNLVIKASDFLTLSSADPTTPRCLSANPSADGMMILGDVALRSYNSVFDKGGARVGIVPKAQSVCNVGEA